MSVVLDSNEFVPTQREDIRKEIDKILDDFMEPLVNQTIVPEIKIIAMAANIPQGFIDGVKFRKTGPNKGEVINTWGTDKKPLALWFNYGTVQHWIQPVTKKALAFPAGSGKHATAIYFQGEKTPEGTKFSKGHYVSGVPRTEAMEIGFNSGKARLAAEASKIVERELHYE
jgi:hypothetical protein